MASAVKLLPLATSQREVWLDQMAWPNTAHLNIGGVFELGGEIDFDIALRAVRILVEQNEALRFNPTTDGQQSLEVDLDINLHQQDFSSHLDARERCLSWADNWIQEPFNVGQESLFRFAHLIASKTSQFVVLHFHHLVMDGWGTQTALRRWAEIYTELKQKVSKLNAHSHESEDHLVNAGELQNPLSDESRYFSFIEESRVYLNSNRYKKDLDFWLSLIGTVPESLFEKRYLKQASDSLPNAHIHRQQIARASYDHFENFAKEQGLSTFHLI